MTLRVAVLDDRAEALGIATRQFAASITVRPPSLLLNGTLCIPNLLLYKTLLNQVDQNSLFNSALKQSSAVRRDLDAFAEAPTTASPALRGEPLIHT